MRVMVLSVAIGALAFSACAVGGDVSNTLDDASLAPEADIDESGDASGGDAPGGDAPGGDTSGGDKSGGDTSGGDAPRGDASDAFAADTKVVDANGDAIAEAAMDGSAPDAAADSAVTDSAADTYTADTSGPDTAGDAGACVPACTELRTCRVATCSWLDILDAVNAARAVARSCGGMAKPAVGPLTWNDKLGAASQRYVDSVAGANVAPGSLSGTAPDGSNTGSRVTEAGYTYSTLTQSIGLPNDGTSPTALVDAMLASSSCNAVMGDYTHFGFAAKKGTTYLYASWYFAKP